MSETALTVEEAILLKMFNERYHEGSSPLTKEESSLSHELERKAHKHFWYMMSRIERDVNKMKKYRRNIKSFDFTLMTFGFSPDKHVFWTSAYINDTAERMYFYFTEELFTVPAAKLIDGRVHIFERIDTVLDGDNLRKRVEVLCLKKQWKSIY